MPAKVPERIEIAVDVDADASRAEVWIDAAPILSPHRIGAALRMVPPVGIDAGENNQLHLVNDVLDIVGGKSLLAVSKPSASGVRLEQISGEIDERIGRHPFAGMQSTRDDDAVCA